jgi:hypothetical protein
VSIWEKLVWGKVWGKVCVLIMDVWYRCCLGILQVLNKFNQKMSFFLAHFNQKMSYWGCMFQVDAKLDVYIVLLYTQLGEFVRFII